MLVKNIHKYLRVEEYFHEQIQRFHYLLDEYQDYLLYHYLKDELEMILNQIIYKEHYVLLHLIQEKVIDHHLTMLFLEYYDPSY